MIGRHERTSGDRAGPAELSMSFRLPVAFRPTVLALLLPLIGCGPGRNEFAPLCPSARLVPALADLTRYAGPGPSYDLRDLVLQARVVSVQGKCQAGAEKSLLPAVVQVSISV